MNLTSANVDEIAQDCMWAPEAIEGLTDEEIVAKSIAVEGIINTYAFDPEKIALHRQDFVEMIQELPTQFLPASSGGSGGWTFLNLCMTKDDVQWTGFHIVQERFMCMCMAAGLAKYILGREAWPAFPDGMPYLLFDPTGLTTSRVFGG